MATVLALETSCDETAAAVVRDRTVLSSVVASQVAIHERYGGVVPEVASRAHVETLGAVVDTALEQANLDWGGIDAIGVTCAPGLVGALMVGVAAAKTLALVHHKPLVAVHHLEGHLYASYLVDATLEPPFLCLLVSGGHTSLIQVDGCGCYQVLGKTRDDAAGEAFDKVARVLGLGYPGGPQIDRLAAEGDGTAFPLPEGNISLPGGGVHPYDSSFSGLKTAVTRLVAGLRQTLGPQEALPVADVAASFQWTVAQGLTRRAIACAQDHGLDTIVLGGGVAANRGLRTHLSAAAAAAGLRVVLPPLKYCTDNAAMIACAAADHFNQGHTSPLTVGVQSRFPLEQVMDLYLPAA